MILPTFRGLDDPQSPGQVTLTVAIRGPRPTDPSKSDDIASLADLQYGSGRCQRTGTLRVGVVAGVYPMPRQVVDGYVQMPEPKRRGNGAGAKHRYNERPAQDWI